MSFDHSNRWKMRLPFILLVVAPFIGLPIAARPACAQTWIRQRPSPNTGESLQCVASSADGSILVVGSASAEETADSIGQIFVSTNFGVTWQTTSAPTNYWASVASSPDGTKFVASAIDPTSSAAGIYTSADSGATWHLSSCPIVGSVASSADGTQLVVAGQGIYHSSDSGATWQIAATQAVGTNFFGGVASSTDGSRLAAVTENLSLYPYIYLSSDLGATWTPANVPPGTPWNSIASSADGRKLVAVGFGGIYTSADYGATWTAQPGPPQQAIWYAVASSADGTTLLVGGEYNRQGLYTSLDSGVTWVSNNVPALGWTSVASSANGRAWAAIPFSSGDYIYTAQSPFGLTVTATPTRVQTGDPIQVLATAQNNEMNTLTNIQIAGPIGVAGSGEVNLVSGPSPAVVASLPPGQTVTFTNIYVGTNYGRVVFTATATGVEPGGNVVGSTASSGTVTIVPNGDLLIKRALDPPDDYAGAGVFQTVPIPPQVETNVVASTNDLSTFQVQIQNNDPNPQTFTLLAQESGNAVWKRTFLLSGSDVTAQLEAPGGMTLPVMAPGTALTLTVTLQDTNALPGDVNSTEFILGLASDATLALDAVQAVTLLVPMIVVNSTGDLPLLDPNGCCCDTGRTLTGTNVAECTLRAAIQLANRNAGKDIIRFQIPANDPGIVNGVPSIQPQTALPDITDSVVIDGWSQSPSASSPPIELSGKVVGPKASAPGELFQAFDNVTYQPQYLLVSGLPSGFHVVANSCEIRGLAINSFPSCGILVDGSESIIQGNYLGTDPTGSLSEPSGQALYAWLGNWQGPAGHAGGSGAQLCLESPGNLVGGSGVNMGNIISGGPNQLTTIGWVGTVGLAIYGGAANGNVVEGNIIGLDASASHTPFIPLGLKSVSDVNGRGQYIGVWIGDGSGNLVGSSTAGAGNIIAGNVLGVFISGDSAQGNVIDGNQIGWSAGYAGDVNAQSCGVSIDITYGSPQQNTVGGSASGADNIIGDTTVGIIDNGTSDTIQGNWIGIMPDGKTAIPVSNCGIFANLAQSPQINGNVVANSSYSGIWLQESPSARVFGNRISACSEHGLEVSGTSQGTVVTLNTIFGNGQVISGGHEGNGVYIAKDLGESGAVTISENSIYNSAGLGIGFSRYGIPFLDSDGGQPVRMIFNNPPPVYGTNGQLQITGSVQASVGSGTYLIEFFGSASANRSGYGEGQTYLGSTTVTIGVLGTGSINVTLPSPNNPGQYLTATATGPDGSTTEFSKAYLIQPCVPGIKGICPGIEANVPSLPSGTVPRTPGPHPLGGSPFGDGNGDGIQDSLESNVASLPSLVGMWVTLAGPTGTTLENVTPTAIPDFTSLPAGYVFPIGFLSFGVTNLPANGAVTITNFLHLTSVTNLNPPYAATTYFNYGPTPDNATPHWYQFLYDGTNGAELFSDGIILHYHDGARGDNDLRVNGEIVTLGAPAYQLPPVPPLSFSVVSIGSSNIVADTNGIFSMVTNSVPVVTGVLTWPTNSVNYMLQYVDDLGSLHVLPASIWQTLTQTPAVVNGRNVVTNTSFGPSGFYRLY